MKKSPEYYTKLCITLARGRHVIPILHRLNVRLSTSHRLYSIYENNNFFIELVLEFPKGTCLTSFFAFYFAHYSKILRQIITSLVKKK